MQTIANKTGGRFFKKDELKTVFVEHEIQKLVGEDDKGFLS